MMIVNNLYVFFFFLSLSVVFFDETIRSIEIRVLYICLLAFFRPKRNYVNESGHMHMHMYV